jgi:BirA family transcriptional regulator, biotin operon repressor / biotin---[acetyl-CoA-carboxylase] ligase
LLLSLCLVRVLKKLTSADFEIKWPNDVLFNKQKIAGILVECKSNLQRTLAAVIGLGINIKLPQDLNAKTDFPATDLYHITETRFNRSELLARFLVEFYQVLEVFKARGFEPFLSEWLKYHCYHNQPVVLHLPNNKIIEGIAVGVTNEGELILQIDSELQSFTIGDISLRPNFKAG